MALERITDGIWAFEDFVKVIPGVGIPTRSTLLALSDGSLVLHAPLAIDDDTAAAIDALGAVRYIVAPNAYHHMFVKRAKARYGDAEIWMAPGLREKRADIEATGYFDQTLPAAWKGELDALVIEGAPALTETVFLHVASKTLVLSDLMFNMNTSRGVMAPLVFRMMGAWKKPAQSRMIRSITKDKGATGRTVRQMLEWDFERVVVGHGDNLTGSDARAVLERSLASMIGWAE